MAGAVYWIGQDGNVWHKSDLGVQNWGSAKNYEFVDGGIRSVNFDTPLGQGPGYADASRIDDPALGGNVLGSNTGGGPALNQAGIDNTQRAIDQLPGLLRDALAAEKTKFGNLTRDFNTQQQQQQGQYDQGSTTNMQNYDANMMDSVRAGVRGLGGLMNLLRGTGVEGQAQDLVGSQTAQDIRGGFDTREANQSQLDTSLSAFLSELDRKRRGAEDTFENNQRAVRRDNATTAQDLYGKMAGFYGDAGRQAEYNDWMAKAGALTPQIAQNSRAQVSKYDTAPVQVKAPEITAFADPTEQSIRSSASEGQLGSGIFTIGDQRRRREQTPAFVGA